MLSQLAELPHDDSASTGLLPPAICGILLCLASIAGIIF